MLMPLQTVVVRGFCEKRKEITRTASLLILVTVDLLKCWNRVAHGVEQLRVSEREFLHRICYVKKNLVFI